MNRRDIILMECYDNFSMKSQRASHGKVEHVNMC